MKDKNIILAVDTSTHILSMSVYKNGEIFCSSKKSSDHSENLTMVLDKLLEKSKLTLNNINLLAVNTGPGSFTGLRIGLSFVKLLAKYLKVKIVATTSFLMLLHEFVKKCKIKESCNIITLFPSVKNEFYFCKFEYENKKIQKILKYGYIKQSEIDLEEADFFLIPNFVEHNIKNFIKLNFSSKKIIDLFLDKNKMLYKTVMYQKLFPFYIRHTYY
jgi:tRNA threonylcarbamoyl adenosine modification protein YeaZ